MAGATDTIKVTETTDWPRLLDEAESAPVRLERDGVVYRLARKDEAPQAGYDPERLRAGLRAFAGTFTPEEGERLKAQIYRAREEGTRPIERA